MSWAHADESLGLGFDQRLDPAQPNSRLDHQWSDWLLRFWAAKLKRLRRRSFGQFFDPLRRIATAIRLKGSKNLAQASCHEKRTHRRPTGYLGPRFAVA